MLAMNLKYLGVLLSDRQQNSAITFVAWIVVGLVVGYVGSQVLNKRDRHLSSYILLSIVGAIVGGFLANLFGKPGRSGLDVYSLLVAMVGGIVFVFVYHALFRRKRFLNMS